MPTSSPRCCTPTRRRPGSAVIVWDIRLPVALLAVVVGGMLGLAGAEMQTILDNPLADPFTLGLSSAAGVGASVAIVTGMSVMPARGADAGHGQCLRLRLRRGDAGACLHPGARRDARRR